MANETSFLKSPKPFGVSDRIGPVICEERFDLESVLVTMAAIAALLFSGSMSRVVRNEVSCRSGLDEVTERKISRSCCWFDLRVPLRSST